MPFLKVDKGLADEADGVQLMKPMPDLDALLERAGRQGRVRHQDALGHQARRPAGVEAVVDQQFEVGRQILEAGLVPIIEPEVDINSPTKAEAEALLQGGDLASSLDALAADQHGDAQADPARRRTTSTRLIEHPNVRAGGGPVGWLQP